MGNSVHQSPPVNPLKRRIALDNMENSCPVAEKRIKDLTEQFKAAANIQRPTVCIRCLNGEPGHITHVLQQIPHDYEMRES